MNKIICYIVLGVLVMHGFCFAAQEEWREKKSRHFVVYYQNTPDDFVDTVLDAAEEYFDEITDNLGFRRYMGWTFDDRARIYIYDNQEHYITSSRQAGWSAGAAHYRQRKIQTYPSASGFFDSLLPHELGHIIFHEFIGDRVSIPLWFSEGVAMYQERAKQWGANQKVKQAIEDGTFIPLPKLQHTRLTNKTPQEKIELFYAQSASIVYYLIKEQGSFRFSNFCRRMQQGDSFERAFEKTYSNFKTLERLNRSWVSYLEKY